MYSFSENINKISKELIQQKFLRTQYYISGKEIWYLTGYVYFRSFVAAGMRFVSTGLFSGTDLGFVDKIVTYAGVPLNVYYMFNDINKILKLENISITKEDVIDIAEKIVFEYIKNDLKSTFDDILDSIKNFFTGNASTNKRSLISIILAPLFKVKTFANTFLFGWIYLKSIYKLIEEHKPISNANLKASFISILSSDKKLIHNMVCDIFRCFDNEFCKWDDDVSVEGIEKSLLQKVQEEEEKEQELIYFELEEIQDILKSNLLCVTSDSIIVNMDLALFVHSLISTENESISISFDCADYTKLSTLKSCWNNLLQQFEKNYAEEALITTPYQIVHNYTLYVGEIKEEPSYMTLRYTEIFLSHPSLQSFCSLLLSMENLKSNDTKTKTLFNYANVVKMWSFMLFEVYYTIISKSNNESNRIQLNALKFSLLEQIIHFSIIVYKNALFINKNRIKSIIEKCERYFSIFDDIMEYAPSYFRFLTDPKSDIRKGSYVVLTHYVGNYILKQLCDSGKVDCSKNLGESFDYSDEIIKMLKPIETQLLKYR